MSERFQLSTRPRWRRDVLRLVVLFVLFLALLFAVFMAVSAAVPPEWRVVPFLVTVVVAMVARILYRERLFDIAWPLRRDEGEGGPR